MPCYHVKLPEEEIGTVKPQTRRGSLFESIVNVAIGYGIALVSQIVIFPLFGIRIPLASNIAIGAIFTVISIVRSYAVRRLFNARQRGRQ